MSAQDLVDVIEPMLLQLYLIRHGGTAWSISGQHTGRTDIPLTPRGENEATRLKHRLDSIGFAHVLTSPSQRARRTCALVGLEGAAEIDADLAARWIGLPLIEAQHFRLDTASLSVLGNDPPHPEVPIIVSWNTTGDEMVGSPGATHTRGAAAMQQAAIARWENEGGESPT